MTNLVLFFGLLVLIIILGITAWFLFDIPGRFQATDNNEKILQSVVQADGRGGFSVRSDFWDDYDIPGEIGLSLLDNDVAFYNLTNVSNYTYNKSYLDDFFYPYSNPLGFYSALDNFTDSLTDGKICIYNQTNNSIQCDYTDQNDGSGSSTNVSLNYVYNGTSWLGAKSTIDGILKLDITANDASYNLSASDLDNVCDQNDNILKRISGTWQCAADNVSDLTNVALTNESNTFLENQTFNKSIEITEDIVAGGNIFGNTINGTNVTSNYYKFGNSDSLIQADAQGNIDVY